jgi:membrane-associated protein
MDLIKGLIDFVLNIDKHLNVIIQDYGMWTYFILFLIVFMETGLVVMPILPGDSLLFAAGAFAALGSLNIFTVFFVLAIAAVLGDTVNYHIGKYLGPKVFSSENNRFLKKEYLDRTNAFYDRHGGKTIIIARFMPIIRTFAPFVAGIGKMNYLKFISYNVVGGLLWVGLFSFAGYFFGNIPFVKENFTVVILAIIFVSIAPGIVGVVKAKFQRVEEPTIAVGKADKEESEEK